MPKPIRIKIEAKSQYGVKVSDKWLNPRRPLTPNNFVLGNEYDVLVETVKKGDKEYHNITQIVGEPVPDSAKTPAAVPPKGRDFEKEAFGKTLCAQLEAAIMSPALAALPGEEAEIVDRARRIALANALWVFEHEDKR